MKEANIGRLPDTIHAYRLCHPKPYSVNYLSDYFRENEDNPYAIWNYLQQAFAESPSPMLTQLPPLCHRKNAAIQREAIARMKTLAKPGDLISTFDRSSGLSQLIRHFDQGMWSHVAMVNTRIELTESTLDGIVNTEFFRLCNPSLDVALFRPRSATDAEGIRVARAAESKAGERGYNWKGVIRLFLIKKLRIPLKRKHDEISPNELIYSNQCDLICYA